VDSDIQGVDYTTSHDRTAPDLRTPVSNKITGVHSEGPYSEPTSVRPEHFPVPTSSRTESTAAKERRVRPLRRNRDQASEALKKRSHALRGDIEEEAPPKQQPLSPARPDWSKTMDMR
jgi:hypothetical protein